MVYVILYYTYLEFCLYILRSRHGMEESQLSNKTPENLFVIQIKFHIYITHINSIIYHSHSPLNKYVDVHAITYTVD